MQPTRTLGAVVKRKGKLVWEVARRREVVECEVCWCAREGRGQPSMLRVMRSAVALATMRLALLLMLEKQRGGSGMYPRFVALAHIRR